MRAHFDRESLGPFVIISKNKTIIELIVFPPLIVLNEIFLKNESG